jgi:hypothetical protein
MKKGFRPGRIHCKSQKCLLSLRAACGDMARRAKLEAKQSQVITVSPRKDKKLLFQGG